MRSIDRLFNEINSSSLGGNFAEILQSEPTSELHVFEREFPFDFHGPENHLELHLLIGEVNRQCIPAETQEIDVRVSDPAVIRVCGSDTGLPFNGKRCLSSECLGLEVVVRATQPAYGDYIVVVRFIGVFHLLL